MRTGACEAGAEHPPRASCRAWRSGGRRVEDGIGVGVYAADPVGWSPPIQSGSDPLLGSWHPALAIGAARDWALQGGLPRRLPRPVKQNRAFRNVTKLPYISADDHRQAKRRLG